MFKSSREIVVEESDIVKILAVIGNHLGYFDGQIGNCRWGEGLESKWFISFVCSEKKFKKILTDLNAIGEFKLEVHDPKGEYNWCFYSRKEKKKEHWNIPECNED